MIERLRVMVAVTLRRLLRSRMIWAVLIAAVIVASMSLPQFTTAFQLDALGRHTAAAQALRGTFVFVIQLFDVFARLVAVLAGVTLIRRDISDGTAVGVLSPPLSRGEYVVGVFAGATVYLALAWLVFGALVIVAAAALHGGPAGLPAAIGGRLLVSLLALSVALLLSLRLSAWAAGLLTVLVLGGGDTIPAIARLLAVAGVRVPESVIRVAAFPFPDLRLLDPLMTRMDRGLLARSTVPLGVLHVADYTAVMVVLACLLFRRLELSRAGE